MNVVILWMCAIVIAGVFGLMLYSVATFHPPSDDTVVSRNRNVMSELLWALVPVAIFIVAALPVVGKL